MVLQSEFVVILHMRFISLSYHVTLVDLMTHPRNDPPEIVGVVFEIKQALEVLKGT